MGYQQLKFPKNSVFLVTGGAGFIGSNLCEAILSLGHELKCLDNLSTGTIKNLSEFSHHERFTFIKGDIRDYQTCQKACYKVDYILHQAAWGSVSKSIKMPLLYEEINVLGTLNMLEAARVNDVKKFVYASSSSVYGDETTLPKKEGREGMVLSPYALTKKTNESYAKLYTKLYGLDTIGLRYFNVFGKKQNTQGDYAAVIPKFIKMLLANERPTIHGDGKQSRDFTYIENVVEANLKALLAPKEATGEVFNIAYGEQIFLLDIYQKLCELLQKDLVPHYSDDRIGDIKHSHADITKAKSLLKYDPQYDFADGISLAIKWYSKSLEAQNEAY